ncbi:MAG TPA: AraC family transcriptional regulator, partial [Chloroflexi bacterium]|nr:AraC family transcriptional regulator [Chloroflexota bacterium]
VNADTLAQVLRSHGLLQSLDEDQVPKRILIVDDEPAVLSIHARLVKAQLPDCQILTARNGLEALQVIRTELPDLVLLDLLMPELDGFGVIEAMQAHELSRQIPVVVLTGQTLSEADIARLNRGTVGVLSKGIYTVQETLHHIAAALAHTREPADEARRAALRAMAYIQAHYDEEISRADIAAHVGLSERHLNRCFRRETGLTPVSYLNRYRIRQAKALLQTRNMTVTEVATSVGFASSGYFARVFRRETGMSPREYQRLGRNA